MFTVTYGSNVKNSQAESSINSKCVLQISRSVLTLIIHQFTMDTSAVLEGRNEHRPQFRALERA